MARIYVALCYLLTVHGVLSTVPGEGDPTHSCNSCCQGPIGPADVPGVPGSAGSNGLHGRDGPKGDAGMKGDIGDSGFPGPHGPAGGSGDPGLQGLRGFQGLPGKVGPRGLTGSPGVDGRPGADGLVGSVGPKGNKGDAPEVNKSAFAVYKTNTQSVSTGDVLTFQVAQTNIGSHFDTSSNKFTCSIAGTYVFMFTIASNNYVDDFYVKLMKDGENITGAHVRDGGTVNNFHQSNNMAILQLTEGNQVWLQFGNSNQVYSDGNKWTSFSGFLLYAE